MEKVKRLLIFLRLVDSHDGMLSLTNVAIFITMFKLIQTDGVSLNDVGLVFATLLNYSYKKYINKEASSSNEETGDANA